MTRVRIGSSESSISIGFKSCSASPSIMTGSLTRRDVWLCVVLGVLDFFSRRDPSAISHLQSRGFIRLMGPGGTASQAPNPASDMRRAPSERRRGSRSAFAGTRLSEVHLGGASFSSLYVEFKKGTALFHTGDREQVGPIIRKLGARW